MLYFFSTFEMIDQYNYMLKYLLIILLFCVTLSVFSKDIIFSQTKVDSLEVLLKIRKNKSETYFELAKQYETIDNNKFEYYLTKASKHLKNISNNNLKIAIYHALGELYYYNGNYNDALSNFKIAYSLSKKILSDSLKAEELNWIGVVYEGKANYDLAIEYYNKSYEINKKNHFTTGMSDNLSNIGMIYSNWGETDEAIKHFREALEIDMLANNKRNIAIDYNNLGLCYINVDMEKSIFYHQTAISIDSSNNNYENIAKYINNIGLVYYRKGELQEAINQFELAVKISSSQKQKKSEAKFLQNIAALYAIKLNNYKIALEKNDQSKEICEKNGFNDLLSSAYYIYYKIYLLQNDYKTALDYFKLRTATQDSIFDKESKESLEHYRVKYETEKKEHEIEAFKKDKIVKNLQIKKQKITIWFISLGLFIFIIFILIVYRAYKQKYKAFETIKVQKDEISEKNEELNQQNEEILTQRDEIEEQSNVLSNQHKQITDSIVYAEQIQKAIFPPKEFINKILPNHFILNMPRDIVSGDFYWISEVDNKIIIAVADCTGHGVPGAFMSMLGTTFLTEIVVKDKILEPGLILDRLKLQVVNALHQDKTKDYGSKDGMDISLCVIDYTKNELHFSGAYNPLVIVSNGVLTEIKGSKMPIGIYHYGKDNFETHNINITKGSTIYMFSDGYQDQFGGKKNKKLGKRTFYNKLTEINRLKITDQKDKLLKLHNSWKNKCEQIDDILVVGIQL